MTSDFLKFLFHVEFDNFVQWVLYLNMSIIGMMKLRYY